jgi:hypothetical protein
LKVIRNSEVCYLKITNSCCIKVIKPLQPAPCMQPLHDFRCQQYKIYLMRLTIVSVILSLLMASCIKDSQVKTTPAITCVLAQTLDSLGIYSKLAGNWTWKKQSTSPAGDLKNADKLVQLSFSTDSTFSITADTAILLQGKWRLLYYGGKSYALQTNPYTSYADGLIYFCDNQVLFMASVYDGVDNVFEKKDN